MAVGKISRITQVGETMTQSEYDALTTEQKMDGSVRFISDGGTDVVNMNKLQEGLAYIVDAGIATIAVPSGAYAYIKNDTNGLAEGLYTNTSADAFPANDSSADTSEYFTAVSGGGLNAVQQSMAVKEYTGPCTISTSAASLSAQFPFESLGLTPPAGYRYLSIMPIVTGSGSVENVQFHIQGYGGYTDDANVGVVVIPKTNGNYNWTIRIVVFYIKDTVYQFT